MISFGLVLIHIFLLSFTECKPISKKKEPAKQYVGSLFTSPFLHNLHFRVTSVTYLWSYSFTKLGNMNRLAEIIVVSLTVCGRHVISEMS